MFVMEEILLDVQAKLVEAVVLLRQLEDDYDDQPELKLLETEILGVDDRIGDFRKGIS